MINTRKLKTRFSSLFRDWSRKHLTGIFVFNVFLALIVLLHSAGYFDPFVPLTINLIFFISMILAVAVLGFRSRGIFLMAVIFWILVMFFRTLSIGIWAERAGVYTFEALFIGVIVLVIEDDLPK